MGQVRLSYKYSVIVGILLMLVVSEGCSKTGDFGRPRQLLMEERTSDLITNIGMSDSASELDVKEGHFAGARKFALTKPEIIIRDSAVHFHMPLTKRNIDPENPLKPTAYAEYMTKSDYTHGPSREGFLASQIKADYIWLKRFSKSAHQVKKDDGERAYYLKIKQISLTNEDRVRTYSRIKENEQLVYGVFNDIDERIASYVYVLERSPLESPGVSMDKAKTALDILRKEASMARVKYDKLVRRVAKNFARRPGTWRPILKRARGRRPYSKRRRGYRRGKARYRRGYRGRGVFGSGLKPLPAVSPKFMRTSDTRRKSSSMGKPKMLRKSMRKPKMVRKVILPEKKVQANDDAPMVIVPKEAQ